MGTFPHFRVWQKDPNLYRSADAKPGCPGHFCGCCGPVSILSGSSKKPPPWGCFLQSIPLSSASHCHVAHCPSHEPIVEGAGLSTLGSVQLFLLCPASLTCQELSASWSVLPGFICISLLISALPSSLEVSNLRRMKDADHEPQVSGSDALFICLFV
jgi:hypothetical protein